MAADAPPANAWLTTQRFPTRRRRVPAAMRAGWIACLLGLAYAAVSVYWGLGGTGLLATVGGSLERAGRQGGLAISLALWAAAALKAVAAAIPLVAVGRWRHAAWPRTVWALAWVECAILIGYGFVLTGAGLLVQAGAIHAGAGADDEALAWHAFVWDPWFLLWGLFVLAALHLARRGGRDSDSRREQHQPPWLARSL